MSEQDWKARAEREAAAFIDGVGLEWTPTTRPLLVTMLAGMWLQGVNLGCHETLAAAEMAFERVQAEL
jgi:hypothetical protein